MIGMIALGLFVVVGCAVGVRLLWTAAHGGGAPAWTCGFGFVSICLLGYPLATIAGVGTRPVGELQHGLGAAGLVFTSAGLASFYAFTLLTFRPRAAWAWIAFGTAATLLAVACFGQIGALASADPAASSADVSQVWTRLTGAMSTLCYAWAAIEALLEWSKSKRRVLFGLCDPVVSNRYLLWAIHGLSSTCLNVFLMTLHFYSGAHSAQGLVSQVALTIFGLISSVTISLAFFPPEAWKGRLRGHLAVAR